ncbi:hypothetical protein FAZ69_29110 [Trinickia terrae]|uniref:Uncharacterized protein n=1 Tax=Trinickia terrae TaxID=2571161 RepID=A0A4U1HNL8_9BURK|nr:hypothetical protein [Trinickia terrae]TKC80376.1 hypothetical protein FAZ69_29110 [Trinickia terrae]
MMLFSGRAYDAADTKFEIAMHLLLIFAGLCPFALIVLVAFARRVDPLSGRLSKRGDARRSDAGRRQVRRDGAWPRALSDPPSRAGEAGAGLPQRAGR